MSNKFQLDMNEVNTNLTPTNNSLDSARECLKTAAAYYDDLDMPNDAKIARAILNKIAENKFDTTKQSILNQIYAMKRNINNKVKALESQKANIKTQDDKNKYDQDNKVVNTLTRECQEFERMMAAKYPDLYKTHIAPAGY